MKALIIEGGRKIPHVHFDPQSGILTLKGRSVPISGGEVDFFTPIVQWIDRYSVRPAKKTVMILDIEFFSTAASKMLFTLFKALERIKQKGNDVEITWYYEDGDDDGQESGNDFQELVDVPFKLIKK